MEWTSDERRKISEWFYQGLRERMGFLGVYRPSPLHHHPSVGIQRSTCERSENPDTALKPNYPWVLIATFDLSLPLAPQLDISETDIPAAPPIELPCKSDVEQWFKDGREGSYTHMGIYSYSHSAYSHSALRCHYPLYSRMGISPKEFFEQNEAAGKKIIEVYDLSRWFYPQFQKRPAFNY